MESIKELAVTALNELKKKYDIPNHGVLAGGALSNYVKYLYDGSFTKPIINDIDIFNFTYNESKDDSKKHNTKFEPSTLYPKLVDSNDYSHVSFTMKDATFYSLEQTSRKEDVNYVDISTNSKDYLKMIDTFDINQTQIGIDLQTNRVYYTDAYKAFLETNTLDIVFFQSPVHSILRCLKKSEESHFVFDADKYITKYIEMLNFEYFEKIKILFSEKYKLLFDKYSHYFKKHNLDCLYEKSNYFDLKNKCVFFVNKEQMATYREVKLFSVKQHVEKETNSVFGEFSMHKTDARMFDNRITLDIFDKYYNQKTNKRVYGLFKKIPAFFYKENYIDVDLYDIHVDEFKKLCRYYKTLHATLYSKTISEQLKFISYFEQLHETYQTSLLKYQPNIEAESFEDLEDKALILRLKTELR